MTLQSWRYDEGTRNSACMALRFIGPAAKQALPDLRKALSDPGKDVRRFAALAIENIERKHLGGATEQIVGRERRERVSHHN